jgi:D-threo-aldose 1-dehydrogenase
MGEAERRIGRAIKANGGLPKDFVLATKLDRDFQTNKFDASRARRSLEESLQALGVDRIPLLHFHDPEYASSLEDVTKKGGALDELFKMKSEGLCQAVGLGAGRTDIMMDLVKDYPFDVVLTHNRYTIVNRHASPLIDACAARGIAVFNAAPYASGVLAQGSATYKRYVYQEATDEVLAPVRAVEAICAKHGVPTGAVALQFSMRNKNLASTICGVTKPEFVTQTIEWASYPISDAVWNELASVAYSTEDPEASRTYVLG